MKLQNPFARFPFILSLCRPLTIFFLLLIFLTVVSAQKPRGSISGRVITDEGGGLPGATVYLSAFSDGSPSAPGRSSKPTTTDADGNFQFDNLPPRSYRVSVLGSFKGYVQESTALADQAKPRPYRLGEKVTIRMVKGGVITGRVLNSNGDPVIGVYVDAKRTRDAEGNKNFFQDGTRVRSTDDRGVYRLYGLQPGTYIVAANYRGLTAGFAASAYDDLLSTYYPSSTLETAGEITVTSGSENSGIDIRFRVERGHYISGKIIEGGQIPGASNTFTSISIFSYQSGMFIGSTLARAGENEGGFAIFGLSDGEYELEASFSNPETNYWARSEPRRVTVRGANVSGIELRLLPLASIAGQVAIETSPNACNPKAKILFEEIAFSAQPDQKSTEASVSRLRNNLPTVAANEKGEFRIPALPPGRYRIQPNLPSENWFIKSIAARSGATTTITTPRQSANKPDISNDLARYGAVLKHAEKLTGVTVTIADGAASLRGKVTSAKEGSKLPSRLRIHLVPAEPTSADEVLRYEQTMADNADFAFTNLSPGKYWLLVRAIPENEPVDRPAQPAAWDAAERAKLRKEAEAAKNEIELKPCQRVTDQILKYTTTGK